MLICVEDRSICGFPIAIQDLCKNASQIIDSIARCRHSLGQFSPAGGTGAFFNLLSGKKSIGDRTDTIMLKVIEPI
ncbi:hypothetical protein [Microcoleus sp.]|uniref:hypothetical protein n=1 Tax=Microcoleus sp. TaxID=44472 RepID=UPI003C754936